MRAIGVRELRQRASEYLRQVQAGRTLEVTARGRAVARLIPIRTVGRRQQLVERGRIVPGVGDLLRMGRPLAPACNIPLPSDLLRRARSGER
jgi:prevent-host-death family protein